MESKGYFNSEPSVNLRLPRTNNGRQYETKNFFLPTSTALNLLAWLSRTQSNILYIYMPSIFSDFSFAIRSFLQPHTTTDISTITFKYRRLELQTQVLSNRVESSQESSRAESGRRQCYHTKNNILHHRSATWHDYHISRQYSQSLSTYHPQRHPNPHLQQPTDNPQSLPHFVAATV